MLKKTILGGVVAGVAYVVAFSAFRTMSTSSATDEVDLGTIEDSVYRNRYFGFELTIPPNWSVQDEDARKRLEEVGTNLVAGDDDNLAAAVKASAPQTVNLLSLFQHPLGSPVPFNQNLICMAERVRNAPGIKTGKDYLYHTKRMLEGSQLDISFTDEDLSRESGGVVFDGMQTKTAIAGLTVQQQYWTTIINGYALTFIISYSSDEQKTDLQRILESVKFK